MLISTLSSKTQNCLITKSEDLDEITRGHLPALAAGLLDDEYVRDDGQVTPFWGLPSVKKKGKKKNYLFLEPEILDGCILVS